MSTKDKLLEVCRELLAIVRLQNGNLHDDINKLQAKAVEVIAEAEATQTDEQFERNEKIRELATEQHQDEGSVEIDDDAVISEGSDNGAYLSCWIWVDFSGTELDKEKKE